MLAAGNAHSVQGVARSMWHHRALEREIHHTTSKLCILGFEPLKQGTKIDGQRPGTSQRFPLWRL